MHLYRQIASGLLLGLMATTAAHAEKSVEPADPHRWLEEVGGEKQLAWVRQHNAVTQKELEASPEYGPMRDQLKTIFNSKERIPYVTQYGKHLYNFWRDAKNIKGVWRRTTLDEYQKPAPKWETVLDLDKLSADEKESWVWKPEVCQPLKGSRCLLSLSRGGGDAVVVREFDLASRSFVKGGFTVPESKTDLHWIDRDTIFIETNMGPGSMTDSGYARQVREWKRGTPLAQSKLVYEAKADDLGAIGSAVFWQGGTRQIVERALTAYTSEFFLREGGKLTKIDLPADIKLEHGHGQLLLGPRSDWSVGGATYPQGALLAIDFAAFMRGARNFDTLFAPTATKSLDNFAVTKNGILLNELDNVKNRLTELTRKNGKWQRRAVDAPAFGALGVTALDKDGSDKYFLSVTDFLTPTTLYFGELGKDARKPLKTLPAYFDPAPYKVEQRMATSKDGTTVPYFLVMRKDAKADGVNPTILYGYGGFEISRKPVYSGALGEAWLKHGGVYAVANIRGGGEFGPRWHQAALKENRQKSFDDFIAVAEDLNRNKITSPRHLGIHGGSNGGLLVTAVMAQRPELFNAVLAQVPLTDMRRYHTMLAGASWMGEYGDPDDPKQWEFLSKYSPYHNVSKGKKYPRTLLTTSTRDDRVHPGHARKMMALMQEQGHDVLYWENTEGGHAGAADNNQMAQMHALSYTFMLKQLK